MSYMKDLLLHPFKPYFTQAAGEPRRVLPPEAKSPAEVFGGDSGAMELDQLDLSTKATHGDKGKPRVRFNESVVAFDVNGQKEARAIQGPSPESKWYSLPKQSDVVIFVGKEKKPLNLSRDAFQELKMANEQTDQFFTTLQMKARGLKHKETGSKLLTCFDLYHSNEFANDRNSAITLADHMIKGAEAGYGKYVPQFEAPEFTSAFKTEAQSLLDFSDCLGLLSQDVKADGHLAPFATIGKVRSALELQAEALSQLIPD